MFLFNSQRKSIGKLTFGENLSHSLAHGEGFTIEKPANFKEVPVFEQQHEFTASGAESSGDIATHLYVPNLTKVSIVRRSTCFASLRFTAIA